MKNNLDDFNTLSDIKTLLDESADSLEKCDKIIKKLSKEEQTRLLENLFSDEKYAKKYLMSLLKIQSRWSKVSDFIMP